jgi:alkanesulfonate monooxygenase SsuD/methylene tetrahydromethanopterin reductase-like flavin-dependent oxidoreductase (luciferase family)
VPETARRYERVARACESIGRDAAGRAPLVLSAALTVCCGRNDAEIRRRARGASVDALRKRGLCGTPGEVVDRIGRYAEVGASRIHLQFLDFGDLDHLDLVAAEVAPQLV